MITYKLNNEMFVCILFVPKKQAIKINAPKKKTNKLCENAWNVSK